MVTAPAIMMTVIGVQSRTWDSPFQFVAATPEESARVYAYRDTVAHTLQVIEGSRAERPAALRKLAQEWIDGNARRQLNPLPAVAYEDSSREGVKGEVIRAASVVGDHLTTLAMNEASSNPRQAIKDAFLATKSVDFLKYGDFGSLSMACMVDRRAAFAVSEALPKLTVAERTEAVAHLKMYKTDQTQLGVIVKRSREQYLEYQRRSKVDPVKIAETEHMIDEDTVAKWSAERAHDTPGHFMLASNNQGPELVSDVRLGIAASVDTDRRIDEVAALEK